MRETLKEIDQRQIYNIVVHLTTEDTYYLLRAASPVPTVLPCAHYSCRRCEGNGGGRLPARNRGSRFKLNVQFISLLLSSQSLSGYRSTFVAGSSDQLNGETETDTQRQIETDRDTHMMCEREGQTDGWEVG